MADDVIASLRAVIGADTKGFDKGIAGVSGALKGLSGLIGGLSFAGLFGMAISEASQAETAVAQLDAALKSTKGAAGLGSQELQDMAGALQKVTRYSDEDVLSAESLLLTFTKVGKGVFPDATEAILDMSTAMGQDLKSSSIQVGKALNDPITGITALRRVGVTFSKAQEDQIKYFMRTNQLAKAQGIILKELQTEFGGSARAAGKTFAGQLDILKNSFSDLLEKIGSALLPVLSKLVGVAAQIIGAIQELDPGLVQLTAGFGLLLVAAGPIGAILGAVLSPLGAIAIAVAAAYLAFKDNFLGIRDTIQNVWSMIQPTIEKITGLIKGFFNILTGGGAEAFMTVKRIGGAMEGAGGVMGTKKISTTGGGKVQGTRTVATALSEGEAGGVQRITNTTGFGERLVKGIQEIGPQLLNAFGELFTKIVNWIRFTAVPDIVEAIRTFVPKAVSWLFQVGIPQLAETFGGLVKAIGGWLIANVPGLIKEVGNFIGNAITYMVTTGIPNLASTLVNGVQAAIKGFLTGLGVDWEKTFGPESDLAKVFNAFFGEGGVIAKVVGFATSILQGISNMIGGIINGIGQAIRALTEFLGLSKAGEGTYEANHPWAKAYVEEQKKKGNAAGGPVTGGRPTLVGERGPEIFTPSTSGRIIPNNRIGGGGGVSIGAITLNGVNNPREFFDAIMREAKRRNERGW